MDSGKNLQCPQFPWLFSRGNERLCGIVRAAHQINRGQYPQLEPISQKPTMNCLWHSGGSQPEHGVQTVCELIEHFLPQTGFNPATDVQVLCPMTRGIVGTRNFNRVLQQLINPPHENKAQLIYGSLTLRVGDRVMQQKNDYHKEVFNGDLGSVLEIDRLEKKVIIQFDGATKKLVKVGQPYSNG